MEQYSDTQLLECNRRSSVEFQAGNFSNNAIFTNKLDAGVRLNVGDTINMQTAIVSDLGAGNDTIELKGSSLKKKKTFTYSKITNINQITGGQPNNLEGWSAQFIEPVTEERELKDNEANLSISYYKTANGEGCFGLPRRYGYDATYNGSELLSQPDNFFMGATQYQIHKGTFIDEDYYRDRNPQSIFSNDVFDNRELYKIRQDGTKYTIFARTKSFSDAFSASVVQPVKNKNGSYDIALEDYYKYVELKNISIPTGRRSADFVAERVTRLLQNASELETITRYIGGNQDTINTFENQSVLTAILKSETFKPFNCQNYDNYSKVFFDEWNKTSYSSISLLYQRGYQYIGFKRPEFVEAGRALRSSTDPDQHLIVGLTSNAAASRFTTSITINQEYNKENCDKLKRFVETQELFPEFWKIAEHTDSAYYQPTYANIPITIDNSRFFHIDMQNKWGVGAENQQQIEFGSDMYHEGQPYTNVPSSPLFFYYDKTQSNEFYDSPFFKAPNNNRLTYGFITKNSAGKITIHPNGLTCGIPLKYYYNNQFLVGRNSTPIFQDVYNKVFLGYDFHFTAYGNAAMGLWADYDGNNFSKTIQIGQRTLNASGEIAGGAVVGTNLTKIVNQLYLGAPDPKLSYDATKDRFGFEGFYTPEFVGNSEAAGEDTLNPKIDGSAQCYKINKRLRRNAYTPGMTKNGAQDNGSYETSTGASTNKDFELPNTCIYPFSIIDSQSGVRIENFGFDEEDWDNGLFSILGFSYNQLQAPLTKNNARSTRINDSNLYSLNTLTNQADVKPGDILAYNQNQFGAIFYQSRIKCAELFRVLSPNRDLPWLSPIDIVTGSNIITAESVPKQMLKPFYAIRSDVLEDTSAYLGSDDSGQPLSTIGVVQKNYNAGDYFYGEESSVVFTITRPKTITHITTAICDPDGSYSNIDDSSVVIYKIKKNRNLPGNIIGQILKNQ